MKKIEEIKVERYGFLFINVSNRNKHRNYFTNCSKLKTAVRRFKKKFCAPEMEWSLDYEVSLHSKDGKLLKVKHPYLDISDVPELRPYL